MDSSTENPATRDSSIAQGSRRVSTAPDPSAPPPRPHGFCTVRIGDIVEETPQARSFVLEVPEDRSDEFAYRAGQFLTVRIHLGGDEHLRCYSMSSAPATESGLKITVKRKPGGLVSNWMHDELGVGDCVDVSPPAGLFTLRDGTGDVLALASGSGITPVISLVKTVLSTTDRKVRLFYANQDRDSVIFAGELAALETIYRHRFGVVHHIYDEKGYVGSGDVTDFLVGHRRPDVYLCGSHHFREVVLGALAGSDVDRDRVFVESFTPGDTDAVNLGGPGPAGRTEPDEPDERTGERTVEVTLRLRGRRHELTCDPGDSLLQCARRAELAPPFSCESGTCATCIAFLSSGEVTMAFNSALTAEEIAEGWVLTCQGYPRSESVEIEYPD